VTGPLVDTAGLATYLKVDVETVRRWVRAGKIPAVRLPGKCRRHLRFDLQAVLAALGQDATAQPEPTERALDIEAHINASRERTRRFLEGA